MKLRIVIKGQTEVKPIEKLIPFKNKGFSKISKSRTRLNGVTENYLKIYVNKSVYKAIWEHANSEPRDEVGGALIGYYCKAEETRFLVVTDVLNMPSEYFKSAAVLKFTTDFICHLDDYMERVNVTYENLLRLGFYHTHPGYGVFLSGTDTKTFKGIFKNDWQIAMVVDPVNEDEGVFFWTEEGISKKNAFYVFEPKTDEFDMHEAISNSSLMVRHNKHILRLLSKKEEKDESGNEGIKDNENEKPATQRADMNDDEKCSGNDIPGEESPSKNENESINEPETQKDEPPEPTSEDKDSEINEEKEKEITGKRKNLLSKDLLHLVIYFPGVIVVFFKTMVLNPLRYLKKKLIDADETSKDEK